MRSSDLSDFVIIGQFGRVHGIDGFIKVRSFMSDPESIFNYDSWYLVDKNALLPTERLQEKATQSMLLVKIKNFEQREDAMLLTGLKIAVYKNELPQLTSDECYFFELIGMEVINKNGLNLGKIIDIFSTGANDVMVIEGKNRYLIPFLLDRFVLKILRHDKQILVDWDENF